MAIRSGMQRLVQRLRQMGEAGVEDYTIAGEVYWSDEHVQDVLDRHRKRVDALPMKYEPVFTGGAYVYKRYTIMIDPRKYGVELVASGDDYFRIADSNGDAVSSDDYTFDDNDLSVTFDTDTTGEYRYYSGYVYDLPAAAHELWTMKAGHAWTAISFTADGHRFDRGAMQGHCLAMAALYDASAATMTSIKLKRTDVHGPGEGEYF